MLVVNVINLYNISECEQCMGTWNVNAWSVECVVSEMSGECHVRTIDVMQLCAVVDT